MACWCAARKAGSAFCGGMGNMGFIMPCGVCGDQAMGVGGVTLIAPMGFMPAPIIGLNMLMRGPMFARVVSSSSVAMGPRPLTILPS